MAMFQTSFGDIVGAIGQVGSWFGNNSKSTNQNTNQNQAGNSQTVQQGTSRTTTEGTTVDYGTDTEQLQIDAAGVMKTVNNLLKDPNLGLAQVLGQEQSVGLYGGSQAAFNTNDLLDKIAGTVAQLTAKKVNTRNNVSQTRSVADTVSQQQSNTDFTTVTQANTYSKSENPGFIGSIFKNIRKKLFRSDARLKSNIVQLGHTEGGVPWYEYEIEGKKEQGVLAQDLLIINPSAVHVDDSGYFLVDYSKVH